MHDILLSFAVPFSNAEITDFAEEQPNSPDPSIAQIFRAPKNQRNAVSDLKRSPNTETSKFSVPSEESNNRVRAKRENTKRSSLKSSDAANKNDVKRSASSKASSKVDRSSRDLGKLSNKDSNEYEAPIDQDRSEYADEVDDDSPAGSGNKDAKYKTGEFRVGDDSERFIDQEERSSLYDDFEAKDVVKRGISGAEDYEEANEDSAEVPEDTAALDEREPLDEQTEKRKVHGDTRVKRERSQSSKAAENSELIGKEEDVGAADRSAKDVETALKDARKDALVAEDQKNKLEKDSTEQVDQSKRNAGEKQEKEDIKSNPGAASKSLNEGQEVERNENAKSLNEEGQEVIGDGRTQGEVGLSDKKAVGELSSLEGISKQEEPKIIADASPGSARIEAPVIGAEAQAAETAGKLEVPVNLEAATGEQSDADYEKRMEEQIQKKIDSIKEQIKREIAENRRMKDVAVNNAKFDELLDEEDDEQEQALQSEPSDKSENLSKRSLKNSAKAQAREGAEKRSIKRRKRQDDSSQGKLKSSGEANLNIDKKCSRGNTRKRSAGKTEQLSLAPKAMPKREYPREVFLVRRDRSAGKKRRKRRSKNGMVGEPGVAKLEDSLPDVNFDPSLRADFKDGKVKDPVAVCGRHVH